MLVTLISLFLYTYTNVAENMFQLLNCTTVGENNYLVSDGEVKCFQFWQYLMIVFVVQFVAPFFIVLLLAPKLIREGHLGTKLFLLSAVMPLILAPYLMFIFIKVALKERNNVDHVQLSHSRLNQRYEAAMYLSPTSTLNQRYSQNTQPSASREREKSPSNMNPRVRPESPLSHSSSLNQRYYAGQMSQVSNQTPHGQGNNSSPVDVSEESTAVAEKLSGAFKENIFSGLCWEGIFNFRRLVLITIYTFTSDRLIRQMALALASFVILISHLMVKPFKKMLSNHIETVSLSVLLLIAVLNLVKAAFLRSGTEPKEENFLAIVVFEWIEITFFGLIPVALIGILALLMVFKLSMYCVSKCKSTSEPEDLRYTTKTEDDRSESSQRSFYTNYALSAYGSRYERSMLDSRAADLYRRSIRY